MAPEAIAIKPPQNCLCPKNLPRTLDGIVLPQMSMKGMTATPPINENKVKSRNKEIIMKIGLLSAKKKVRIANRAKLKALTLIAITIQGFL